MKGAAEITQFVKETEWGTTPGIPTWVTALQEGPGLDAKVTPELVEVVANDTYPQPRSQEIVASKVALTYKSPLYIDSCQALINMGWERDAAHELYGYSWRKKDDLKQEIFTGAKVQSMSLDWKSNGLVELSLDMIAKSQAATTSIVAGTYPTGMPYKGGRIVLVVAGVTIASVESGTIKVANNLTEGPISGEALQIAHLDAGLRQITGSFKAKFTAATWDNYVRTLTNGDLTAFAASVTFANNSGATAKNMSLTFGAGTLKATGAPHELSGQADTVMQTLEVVQFAAAPTWAFPA